MYWFSTRRWARFLFDLVLGYVESGPIPISAEDAMVLRVDDLDTDDFVSLSRVIVIYTLLSEYGEWVGYPPVKDILKQCGMSRKARVFLKGALVVFKGNFDASELFVFGDDFTAGLGFSEELT